MTTSKKLADFTVHGNPVPKQSFRYSKKGSYQSKRVMDWQESVGWAGKMQAPDRPLRGPFNVVLTFYRRTKRRVDLDNLSKAVLDALNGIYWVDDTQVVSLFLRKEYDKKNPRVEVKIWHKTPKE